MAISTKEKNRLARNSLVNWQVKARTDPDIQKWWSMLPDSSGIDIITFMNSQKNRGIYDYQKAIESGNVPKSVEYDIIPHWDDSGKLKNNPNLNNQLDNLTKKSMAVSTKEKNSLAKRISGTVKGAGETVGNFAKAGVGNAKSWYARNYTIPNKMSKDLPSTYTNMSKQMKNIKSFTSKGNFSGGRGYLKGQLTKMVEQTGDVPASNEWLRNKLKKYNK